MVGLVFYIAHFTKFKKFAIYNVKTRFPFLYASTSLDRNFDSCLSIRCLAPQQILRFFFFFFLPQVLPFPLATVLIIASSSSMLHLATQIKKKKKKKEGVADGLRFLGNLYISSLTPRGPIVPLFWGSRRGDNLLAWRELFANLYELKPRIWFWKEYNPNNFIDWTNFRQISKNFLE